MSETLSSDLVSPFQLAYMAVRGELDEGGMDNYSVHEARRGNDQGRSVVEAAINKGYISSDLMEDEAYISRVNQVLRMQAESWRT